MASRNRLLGFAALALGGKFALDAIGQAFQVATVLDDTYPGGIVAAESLDVLQFLVLLLASFFAAQAFLFPPEKGNGGLRGAALLAGAGYGFGLLSDAFTIQGAFSEPHSHAFRSAAVLGAALSATVLAAALAAAGGFSQTERHNRDRRLGWAGIAFMAANLLALAEGVVRSEYLSGQGDLGTLTAGLNLGHASFAIAATAGAIAAFAFFDAARGDGPAGDSLARRDLLLAAAAGVYGIFALLDFASEAIVAIANSDLGLPTAVVAPTWFAAIAALGASGAALCAMAALQPPFLQALPRLHRQLEA